MTARKELEEDREEPLAEESDDEAVAKLNLGVKIDNRSACQRHITVTVSREDIDRYFNKAFSDLMPTVSVPGFRAGRAPRKLVESRFQKEVADQVKGSLLLDSMTQVSDDHQLAAISEPDIDPVAVVIPETGDLTFEFDLEVRPEFDLPEWKGLAIERPVYEFSEKDVDQQLQRVLAGRGKLVAFEGAAKPGDYITTNLSFTHDGQKISNAKEEVIRLRPTLSFRDGKIEGFDKLMKGVVAGETREGKAKLSNDAPNAALRNKNVTAIFEVLEVKKLEMPELTPELLDDLGGFENEGELREAIRASLLRRLEYQQQQRARQQVLGALTVAADWELPPEMLKRQSQRELQRSVLELRRSGFSEAEIRNHENEIRQNNSVNTARALKEHFILERLAEEHKIDATPDDYDREIELIAEQSAISPRKVRAQLEKGGMMDSLRNQVVERKAIEMILEHAKFKDVPYQPEGLDAEAIDQSAGGDESESEIPEAKYSEEAQPLSKGTENRS